MHLQRLFNAAQKWNECIHTTITVHLHNVMILKFYLNIKCWKTQWPQVSSVFKNVSLNH